MLRPLSAQIGRPTACCHGDCRVWPPRSTSKAAAIVDAALRRGTTIDAVDDLASALPLAAVPDLVGWPRDERGQLIRWGGATFDVLGPFNWRAVKSFPRSLQMLRFAQHVVSRRAVLGGSMVDELLTAVDAGSLSPQQCRALMIDYIAPLLDTTISAISNAGYLLATHPDQWDLLKADPNLVPNAVNEILRYESPLRAFASCQLRHSSVQWEVLFADSFAQHATVA